MKDVMDNGWIKLHRKISDNPIWKAEPFSRGQAWVDLILLANHKDGIIFVRDHRIEIARGDVGYSQNALSLRWKWSRTKVRKFLNMLEKEQQIKQIKSHSYTVIRLINYDDYQQEKQQKDNSRTTAEQQKDTNKNVKKGKNEKNDSAYPFDSFWNDYAKKIDRKRAESLYSKINEDDRIAIKSHIPEYLKAQPDPKYRKDPTTYLRGENWNDEIVAPNQKQYDISDLIDNRTY
jgi:hypothetical protein